MKQARRIICVFLMMVIVLGTMPSVYVDAVAQYNASSAVAYANSHWDDGVGLCAQFVSNCLAAGGVTIPNNASYYSSSTQSYQNNSGTLGIYTNPYTCSASLLLYLSKYYTVITDPMASQIAVGDVVFMNSGSWRDGHVGIIISTDGGVPIYAAHNKATNTGKFYSNYPCTYVVKMGGSLSGEHTCNKGEYMWYEECHPHYKCYECSICGTVWRNTAEPTIVPSCTSCVPEKVSDSRYSSFLPIAAYPISTGHISVYDNTGTEYSNRYIDGATDLCLILEIYTDGWCKVRYPSSVETSGYFDAYVPLSTFTSSSTHSSWTATDNYTTYKRSDLGSTMHNVSSGAACLLLKTDGSLKQIIHPVSGQEYCMMGWIYDPKQIHVSSASVNLTLGGTESAVIYAWSTGSHEGSTALYYNQSNSNISCSWGEWTDGKAPLTITANAVGTTTLTLGVKDSSAGTVLDSTTVTVTVNAKSYTVSYNANGGIGAPDSQTKYHNTTLTLSSTKPTQEGYTFLGWATSSTAIRAAYQPGGAYADNSSITLYAVWEIGCEGDNHSYHYTATTKPTATTTGQLKGICTKCGIGTTFVTLPKLNTTDYTYIVTKEPSYSATGTARYTWKNTAYGAFYFEVTLDKLPVTLTKIEVATNPTKTVYRIGESLNTTGLSLKATYSDGSTKTITSGFTTTGFSSTTAGTKTVTVTYEGKSTTFTVSVQAATSETDAQIVVESKTAVAGETVSVTIVVKNNPGIASLKLRVAYDPMLTLTGVTYNMSIGGQFQQPQKLESPVTLNWFNGTADSEGDWIFATLTFAVSDSAEGGSSAGVSVTYNPDDVYDITETNIPFAIVNGSVEIIDYLPGDINGDGVVNNKDVTRLFQYLSDWDVSVNEAALDVNGDGTVNNKDLTRLFQYLSDWDVSIH